MPNEQNPVLAQMWAEIKRLHDELALLRGGEYVAESGTTKALQGYAVQDHAPEDGEGLFYVAGNSQYEPKLVDPTETTTDFTFNTGTLYKAYNLPTGIKLNQAKDTYFDAIEFTCPADWGNTADDLGILRATLNLAVFGRAGAAGVIYHHYYTATWQITCFTYKGGQNYLNFDNNLIIEMLGWGCQGSIVRKAGSTKQSCILQIKATDASWNADKNIFVWQLTNAVSGATHADEFISAANV